MDRLTADQWTAEVVTASPWSVFSKPGLIGFAVVAYCSTSPPSPKSVPTPRAAPATNASAPPARPTWRQACVSGGQKRPISVRSQRLPAMGWWI